MGENNYQAKKIEIILPDQSVEIINGNLVNFAKKHKMSRLRILEMCNGKLTEWKGYKAKFL